MHMTRSQVHSHGPFTWSIHTVHILCVCSLQVLLSTHMTNSDGRLDGGPALKGETSNEA